MSPSCLSALSRLVEFFPSWKPFTKNLRSNSLVVLKPHDIPSATCVQSTQYYDMRWSCEHLIMVWINAFVMLMSQLLPPSYCDLLHRSAAHLGRWQKLEHGSYSNAPQHLWASPCVYTSMSSFCTAMCVYVCVVNCGLDVFLDGLKAPFGPKECWYDTVDVCTRPLGLIMSLCPQMSPMRGFTWVLFISLKQQQ